MKMVELLDVVDAFQLPPYTPLRASDLKHYRGVDVDSCRVLNARGRRAIDLPYLLRVLVDHQIKMREEGPVFRGGTDEAMLASEAAEVRLIMADALRRNQVRMPPVNSVFSLL